jgi:hypothetical protein
VDFLEYEWENDAWARNDFVERMAAHCEVFGAI